MKQTTLLVALILIATIGFSQNKIGGNDPIGGIDIIILKDPSSQPIVNKENNPLIEEVNKLELEYLNLKAKEVHYGFANQDLSKVKTKDDVFKEYIAYLQKVLKSEKIRLSNLKTDNNIDASFTRRMKSVKEIPKEKVIERKSTIKK